LAEYGKLRDSARATAEDQAALARWCRRNKLADEERVHWLFVRQLDPDNAEAIKALGLHPFQGKFFTNAQIEQIRAETRAMQKAMERWRPLVAWWTMAVENEKESLDGGAKLEEVREVSRSSEMLALERVMWHDVGSKKEKKRTYEVLGLALVAILREMPQQPAVESLARHAVFSSAPTVRSAATAALKERPWDRCVPLLILSMGMPIKETGPVSLNLNGSLAFRASLFQEGPMADLTVDVNLDYVQPGFQRARDVLAGLPGGALAAQDIEAKLESANAQSSEAWRASLERKVERTNGLIAKRNQQIREVLVAITGQEAPDDQMSWWDWWQKYNELSIAREGDPPPSDYSSKTPGGYSAGYGSPYGSKSQYNYSVNRVFVTSCFARGTKVWTLTGPRAIDSIKPGDRVLSQNPDSGELAFKPVLAVTYRPPSVRVTIGVAGEKIMATLGHPFWVAAEGWRMTKELKTGSRLQGLEGEFQVESLDRKETPGPWDDGAFNLIVADFNTYFVGEHLLLVHDNTPRLPPTVAVPELLRRESVAAAGLAR
jgi:hypothetical protein